MNIAQSLYHKNIRAFFLKHVMIQSLNKKNKTKKKTILFSWEIVISSLELNSPEAK